MIFAWETALDERQRFVLANATRLAERLDVAVYLVGGPVRDLLLDRPVFDLDFSVAGDARAYARALAAALDCEIIENVQFQTWRLEHRSMRPIDVVTCRKETYRFPGALPDVEAASLEDDLARRDFSINTLAVELRERKLIDLWDGVRDLEGRLVRVLHDRSFRDDPTRIYRALRIAARLGFELEPRTSRLLEEAIRDGALKSVSPQRLWRELFLAIDEGEPARALLALADAGALQPLIAGVTITAETRASLIAIGEMIEVAGATRIGAFLSALVADGTESPRMEGAPLRQQAIEQIGATSQNLRGLTRRLTATTSTTRRILLLDASPAELRALAASRSTLARESLHQWSSYRTPVTDSDFSRSIATRVGRRTGHYLRLVRLLVNVSHCSRSEAHSLAEAAILRYLQRRTSHS